MVSAVLGLAMTAGAGIPENLRPATVETFMRLDAPTRIIAHRGFSAVAPENTLAAVRWAIAAGADMVEVDVTVTADGHVICLHDDTLDRTTDGRGPATALPLAAIAVLDAGSWFEPRFTGERVPTLDQVLALVEGRMLVNVEIKPEAVEHDAVAKVAALIRRRAMLDQVVVSSFAPEALRRMKLTDPEVVTVSLLNEEEHAGLDPLEVVQEVGSRGLNVSSDEVTPELVERCHRHGLPVSVYTVNSKRQMRRLVRMGVHAIFTDHPDRLRDVVTESALPSAAAGAQ